MVFEKTEPLTCRDYRPNEVLDAYEEEGIDEAPDMDVTMEEQLAARQRAERELNKRDRHQNRGGLPGALNGECQLGNESRVDRRSDIDTCTLLTALHVRRV